MFSEATLPRLQACLWQCDESRKETATTWTNQPRLKCRNCSFREDEVSAVSALSVKVWLSVAVGRPATFGPSFVSMRWYKQTVSEPQLIMWNPLYRWSSFIIPIGFKEDRSLSELISEALIRAPPRQVSPQTPTVNTLLFQILNHHITDVCILVRPVGF